MAQWLSSLSSWGRWEEVEVDRKHINRTIRAIQAWMQQKKILEQEREPGLRQLERKNNEKRKRKEQLKQKVVEEWDLEVDPPEGVVRAWTDGSEQEGQDGRSYAGYGVWFGPGHTLNASEKLMGLMRTNNRAEMTAVRYVLKRIPSWVTVQICTDLQLVVDLVLYWMAGWKQRGWKTKSGKMVENVDLWEAIQEALEDRTGETIWVKVPSHTDIEGNKEADRLAKEGVEKHGVPLKGNAFKEKNRDDKKRKQPEEQLSGEARWNQKARKKYPEADSQQFPPQVKRSKRSSLQVLLDLGPLLPRVVQQVPQRLYKVAYINLDRQPEDEQHRGQLMVREEQARATVETDMLRRELDLWVRCKKLRRWTLLVVDRRLRTTLRVMGQVQWAEVHLREGTARQEGLEWEHLLEYLILAQERVGRKEMAERPTGDGLG